MNLTSLDERALPIFGLWSYVWKLLRLSIIIQVSAFRRAKLGRKLLMIFFLLLTLAFIGFVFFISWKLLGFLNSPELSEYVGETSIFLDTVPVGLVGGAFLGILLTSFGVLLQTLYLAGDMDFLLSAPIPIRAVFITKLLQAILPNFSLICLFALPILYGLGAAQNYNFLYYPLVLLVLSALALAAAGISSLLVMWVVRIFPARRVAEILGLIGAIVSFTCSQSGNVAQFNDFSSVQTSQALSTLTRLNSPWLPISWAGRGLIALGEGDWLPAVAYLLLTLGLAAGAFVFSLFTAERLYYSGWASVQISKQRKKKVPTLARPERKSNPLLTFLTERIPSSLRAIFIKDMLMLRRDLRNMSQLVTPLIFGIIYGFMMLRSGQSEFPAGQGEAPAWFIEGMNSAITYANVGLSLFVSWMLVSRLAGMGFSQEGKNYWLLKSAPLSPARLATAKFLVAYLPVLALSLLFMLVFWLVQGASIGILLFAIPVIFLNIAGNVGLNLAFGVVGANMNWENPQQMQKGLIGCLGSLVNMIYMVLDLMLFFGPPALAAILGWRDVSSQLLSQLIGLALGGGLSLLCALLPPWLTLNHINRLAEA